MPQSVSHGHDNATDQILKHDPNGIDVVGRCIAGRGEQRNITTLTNVLFEAFDET